MGGGYQEWFVGFHTLDTNSLYYTGEQMFFESYIQTSNNNGQSWSLTGNIHNHATHTLAFHPTDTNTIISGGEGLIGKSYDKGLTWSYTDTIPIYITDIKFDISSPNILYATGDFHGINDTIEIYRSIDGGNNWNLFYSEYIPNSDGALELHIHNDKLILYTMINGVFLLDLAQTNSLTEHYETSELKIFPNPTYGELSYQSEQLMNEINILDMQGRVVSKYWPTEKSQKIDCSNLDNGSYIILFRAKNGVMFKTLLIKQ